MDAELLYSMLGIIGFIFIIYFTLRAGSTDKSEVKTKAQKKAEIISEYRKNLQESLAEYANDKEGRIARKTSLLKGYSDELSRNIFFDSLEVKEIILELSLES